MYKILVFAGTTEGREVVEFLKDKDVEVHVCVATEYGETLIEKSDNIIVYSKRLDYDEMVQFMRDEKFDLVLDTTHPYAVIVTENIVKACESTSIEYIRLVRDSAKVENINNAVFVDSVDSAVEYLKSTSGNVLVTTGSKEVHKYTAIDGYKDRIFARVLSTADVVKSCTELGFTGRNLIAMQGPFTEEFNYALMKQIDAKYMVTKESGTQGGYEDKIVACEKAGAKAIIIGRPYDEKGLSFNEVITMLKQRLNIKTNKKIYLVGIGMGSLDSLTIEAKNTFERSQAIIGARRIIDSLKSFNKPMFNEYKRENILKVIEEHEEYENIAIALSGDAGFYSNAKGLLETLKDYDVEIVPGLSSVVYFAAKVKTSWDDMKLLSLHGKNADIAYEVAHNKKVFSLLGGNTSVKDVCKELSDKGLGDSYIYVGQNLSYEEEVIKEGKVLDFVDSDIDGLTVIIIKNDNYKSKRSYVRIKDEEFIRAKVPMTKEEIRNLSIVKLDINEDSIIYDVGAGTGSVSMEMALNAPKGKVYAIEKKDEAIELINLNKDKFNINNLEVIHGTAPEALKDLECPTHAFIGGSSGNLKYIIKDLLDKNPNVKMTVNAITLETLAEAMECIKEFSLEDVDITQLTVANSRKLGRYNLMTGQNPIYIISFKGGKQNES